MYDNVCYYCFFIALLASGDQLGMLGGVVLVLLAQRILGSFQQLLNRNLIYFTVLSSLISA